MYRIFAAILVVFLIAGSARAACNLRCPKDDGSQIVCDGDTKFETIRKCGEPDFIEEVGFDLIGSYGEVSNATGVRGARREFLRKVDKWYYDCGEGRFVKEITFKGNEIFSIENTDQRGSGSKKCW